MSEPTIGKAELPPSPTRRLEITEAPSTTNVLLGHILSELRAIRAAIAPKWPEDKSVPTALTDWRYSGVKRPDDKE